MESTEPCERKVFEFVSVKEDPCDLELEEPAVAPFEFTAAKQEPHNLDHDEPAFTPVGLVPLKGEPPDVDPDEPAVAPFEFIAVKEEPSDDAQPGELPAGQVYQQGNVQEYDIRYCDDGTTSSKGLAPSTEDDIIYPEVILKTDVHHASKRETSRQYICSTCSRVFPSKYSIIKHVFTHLEGIDAPPHVCRLCGLVVMTAKSLAEHSRSTVVAAPSDLNQEPAERNLHCLVCREAFRADGCLQAHMMEHSGPSLTSLKTNTDGLMGDKLYKCDICGTSCVTLDEFKTHKCVKNILELYDCKICKKYFETSSSLDEHYLTHEGEKYRCQTCGKSFRNYHNLTLHTRVHTGEKPYVCEVCNKGFAHNKNLRNHKFTHEGELPHACEFCDRRFSRTDCLNIHRRTHSGEKPYVCNICLKAFAQLSNMKQHELTHTGLRPYICDLCGKSFQRSCDYNRHKKTHLGVKSYKCHLCSKCFTQGKNLRNHILSSHSNERNYLCEICQKSFSNPDSVKEHMIMHDDNVIHVCGVCGKGLKRSSALRRHERSVHGGEKPHKCQICSKSFGFKWNLSNHMKIHEKKSST